MPDVRETLQAALGSKYRIARELTGGGMSRVFFAHDEQLEREVVVKLLSPDMLDEARIERFRQEVLQTARLQHPTIVPVIEVGAIQGTGGHRLPYYIMPYARGESLRSRMHQEGQLSLSATMRILRSVFDALAYAHAHGVVHRDIKPENIFLSGSNALVADFGIAKAIAGPGSLSGVTQPGMAVGTPTYMAPEQIIDADRVGPRADLFAVGIVAYEMLTGRLPWGTQTPVDVLKSQAHGRVTPLRSIRPEVSVDLANVIEACLAWDAERRPESAAAVLHMLDSVAVQSTPDSADAIAKSMSRGTVRRPRKIPGVAKTTIMFALLVLGTIYAKSQLSPGTGSGGYTTVGLLYPELPEGTPDREAVELRLYHMLTETMAAVPELRTIGNPVAQGAMRRRTPTSQVVDSLLDVGAKYVLGIAASSLGGATALSVERHDGGGAPAEILAGPLPIGAPDQLTLDSLRQFVRILATTSLAKLRLGSAGRATADTRVVEAYMAALEGRDNKERRTADGTRDAISSFERAISIDTAYAGAHAELSQTLTLALVYHFRLPSTPFELAARGMSEAERAVQLRPDLAEGHLALALLGVHGGADTTFLKEKYNAAEQLNSDNPDARSWQLGLLGRSGRFDDAAQGAEEEVALAQGSAGKRFALAMYSLAARHYDRAIINAKKARELRPDVPSVTQIELWAHVLGPGPDPDACTAVPAGPYLGAKALCLELNGRDVEAKAVRDSLEMTLTSRAPADSSLDRAVTYAELAAYDAHHGNAERTRRWIRSAFSTSPFGIDYRMMQSGMFEPWAIAYADSLRRDGWQRVIAMSRGQRRR